ncbi:MAG: RsmE family RNA methyltransferase [Pseudomonadota bacterium]|nr:RsmE family RNA methyltransferase [Pseudomonadota bacterium]
MNLVLLEPAELGAPLPRVDPRARHILDVLRRREGDTFHAGVVDGPIGTATLDHIATDALIVSFVPIREPPPLPPITLIVGLPRPPTARDILRDATTCGVAAIHFVATERTDPNYATSTIWRDGEWRRHLLVGAAQAFDTRLPVVTWTHTLGQALTSFGSGAGGEPAVCLALDNYEAEAHLGRWKPDDPGVTTPIVLALGPERGWGPADRARLRNHGATLLHLGKRVLRVEMAVVAALAILQARLGE